MSGFGHVRPPANDMADRRRTEGREWLAMLSGFGDFLRFWWFVVAIFVATLGILARGVGCLVLKTAEILVQSLLGFGDCQAANPVPQRLFER